MVYDHTNTERLSAIDFGSIVPGSLGQEVVVWLWNKMNFRDAPSAIDVRVSVIAGNAWAETIALLKYVSVKSSGVLDPDGIGILDDLEDDFTPIGGPLTDPGAYHSIGDIPTNCARRLTFRIDIPHGFDVHGIPRLIIQTGFLSSPVKWLYAKD